MLSDSTFFAQQKRWLKETRCSPLTAVRSLFAFKMEKFKIIDFSLGWGMAEEVWRWKFCYSRGRVKMFHRLFWLLYLITSNYDAFYIARIAHFHSLVISKWICFFRVFSIAKSQKVFTTIVCIKVQLDMLQTENKNLWRG